MERLRLVRGFVIQVHGPALAAKVYLSSGTALLRSQVDHVFGKVVGQQ